MGLDVPRLHKELATHFGEDVWLPRHTRYLWSWIYRDGREDFNRVVGLKRELWEGLTANYDLGQGLVTAHSIATDGTRKWLITFNNQEIESVYIPEKHRGTLCVSSQIGCSMACSFCHTGTQSLMRNLTSGEIVSQIMQARRLLNGFEKYVPEKKDKQQLQSLNRENFTIHENTTTLQNNEEDEADIHSSCPARDAPHRKITNIVFMGQGEPLYNYRAVREALGVITHSEGLSIGQRKVTVSTSGVVPAIYKLAQDFKRVGLAISLHAVNDKLRNELVPINRTYPLAELMKACHNFCNNSINRKTRRLMFEYVMLKGVNDREEDVVGLIHLAAGLPVAVNLIPFNPWPGTRYECSSYEQIIRFNQTLLAAGVFSTIRWPRGKDIMAACGQLKTHHQQRRSSSMTKTY